MRLSLINGVYRPALQGVARPPFAGGGGAAEAPEGYRYFWDTRVDQQLSTTEIGDTAGVDSDNVPLQLNTGTITWEDDLAVITTSQRFRTPLDVIDSNGSNSHTYAVVYANIAATHGGWHPIWDSTSQRIAFWWDLGPGNECSVVGTVNSSSTGMTTVLSHVADELHSIIVTYDEVGEIILYYDGVEPADATRPGFTGTPLTQGAAELYLGSNNGSADRRGGKFGCPIYYPKALTSEEVSDLHSFYASIYNL